MRKTGFVVALVAVLLCGVFVSARIQNPKQQFIPHTIVYRFTQYDEAEKPFQLRRWSEECPPMEPGRI